MPFFKTTELSMIKPQGPVSTAAQCGLCGLFKTCLTPKMQVSGEGKRKVLIVAEAPGEHEDKQGIQLVGNSGQKLIDLLKRVGVDMRKDCWLTNSLICRPQNNEIKDKKWIDYCRPNLLKTIRELQPETIILLGGVPVDSLISWLWKDKDIDGVTKWVGWKIPAQKINAWVCPTYHPSYLLRMEDKVLDRECQRHLSAAFRLQGRPWKEVPNYQAQVRTILSPQQAAVEIRKFHKLGVRPVAFDYETTCLKPESVHARIVCCSLSDGKNTLAYPWHGPTIEATKEILIDPLIEKEASNLDFEDRWTRRHLKVNVRNWGWDTMLGAHTLDSRGGISSIKFQSFVLLGQPSYNDHIEPYLGARGGTAKNRIEEVDLKSLLLYCGLDSLMESLVAKKQRQLFLGA